MFRRLSLLFARHREKKAQQAGDTAVQSMRTDDVAIIFEIESSGSSVESSCKEIKVPWGAITKIVAIRTANFVGDDLLVLLEHSGIVPFSDDTPGYDAAMKAVNHNLVGSRPYPIWEVELIASGVGVPITIYERLP